MCFAVTFRTSASISANRSNEDELSKTLGETAGREAPASREDAHHRYGDVVLCFVVSHRCGPGTTAIDASPHHWCARLQQTRNRRSIAEPRRGLGDDNRRIADTRLSSGRERQANGSRIWKAND